MRVLFFHSGSDLYGASRSLLRLATELTHSNWEVRVILPGDGPLVAALAQHRIEVDVQENMLVLNRRDFKGAGAFRFLARTPLSARQSARLAKSFQPDLIHSNTATLLNGAMAARKLGVPHVWHVRDSFREFGAAWKIYGPYILSRSSRVICVSKDVASQFQFHGAGTKVIVIHNGLDPAEFAAPAGDDWLGEREEFRSIWGIGPATCAIGLPGRLKIARKGQDTLIEAASRLARAGHDFKVVLIGSAFPGNEEHEEKLHALCHQRGLEDHVLFAGDLPDPRPAYAGLDVVVMASATPEPFGGVVLEAMAMRKPVVGTNIGGTPEQIENGATGLLVPPADPERLAEALASLIADPELRERMGAAGRRRLEERFTLARMMPKIFDCYRTVTQSVGA